MHEYLALVWELAKTDFKLRYVKARLGFLWAVLFPFITFGVLYVVFALVVYPTTDATYVFSLLLGIILWSFFFDATTTSIDNLIGKRALIRNVPFPISAVTFAACFDSFIVLFINVTIFLGALLISGFVAAWTWLLVIPLLIGFFAFTAGISQLLSGVNAAYRDIKHIWLAMLQLGFFLSPIIYTVSSVPAQYQRWYFLNPLALVIHQGRLIFLFTETNRAAISAILVGGLAIAALGSLFVYRMQFTIREEL